MRAEATEGTAPLEPATDLSACLTCGAIVATKLATGHDAWHEAISSVAIEQTRRINLLAAAEHA